MESRLEPHQSATPPLIQLTGTHVTLDGHEILKDIDFSLGAGENWAIQGGNGAGKSTLLRVLAGALWPHPHTSRVYHFGSEPTWSPLKAREHLVLLSPEVQDRYVRQLLDGPDNEKGWQLNVREAVLAGYFGSELLHQRPTPEQEAGADSLMEQLAVHTLAERPLQNLSQGQMRRVLLARALISRPRLLLLDEACSGLDKRSRHEMLDLIERIASGGQCQVLMTTHRPSEIVPAITHVLTLRSGKLREVRTRSGSGNLGGAEQISAATAAKPAVSGEARPVTPGAAPVSNPDVPVPGAQAVPYLDLQNVSVYLDGTPILEGINWKLWRGRHWAVAGANGTGKSTFLRLLRGELWPALGGTLLRFGSGARRSLQDIGEDVSLLSPAIQARYRDELPVRAAIASGFEGVLGRGMAPTPAQWERVEELLHLCHLAPLADRTFGRLSYGQTRRVLLARALVHAPQVLLLDEALDGLDAESRDETGAILARVASNGTSVVVVSHHEEDWPDFLTDVMYLEGGRIASTEELVPFDLPSPQPA